MNDKKVVKPDFRSKSNPATKPGVFRLLRQIFLIHAILLLNVSESTPQIPVEVFGGHERSTIDIMFFKFFRNREKNAEQQKYRWLFFNRNRASIDYRMTETGYLPQFGFTEAVSYNHEKLHGFAPVGVVQVLNGGVYPKAGVQYAKISKNMTVFTWLVCETREKPDLDYFLLLRFTPKITKQIHLFSQAESVNTFPSGSGEPYSFTQRFRLGFQLNGFQFGAGADFNQRGKVTFTHFHNIGFFLRHEF